MEFGLPRANGLLNGKIEGNRLVFTRHLESFRGLLEDVTPEEMEEVKPYTAYYSPVEEDSSLKGHYLRLQMLMAFL